MKITEIGDNSIVIERENNDPSLDVLLVNPVFRVYKSVYQLCSINGKIVPGLGVEYDEYIYSGDDIILYFKERVDSRLKIGDQITFDPYEESRALYKAMELLYDKVLKCRALNN